MAGYSVAGRLLLQKKKAGNAWPDAVDRQKKTLLTETAAGFPASNRTGGVSESLIESTNTGYPPHRGFAAVSPRLPASISLSAGILPRRRWRRREGVLFTFRLSKRAPQAQPKSSAADTIDTDTPEKTPFLLSMVCRTLSRCQSTRQQSPRTLFTPRKTFARLAQPSPAVESRKQTVAPRAFKTFTLELTAVQYCTRHAGCTPTGGKMAVAPGGGVE